MRYCPINIKQPLLYTKFLFSHFIPLLTKGGISLQCSFNSQQSTVNRQQLSPMPNAPSPTPIIKQCNNIAVKTFCCLDNPKENR
ncbi:hypothetical protein FDUTEX481_04719 [Tolypothrix sp. PCC 7601]|nr:hypothetical protein FDUTEX481_04719 [Tolypothrix sp. PCC 7601]